MSNKELSNIPTFPLFFIKEMTYSLEPNYELIQCKWNIFQLVYCFNLVCDDLKVNHLTRKILDNLNLFIIVLFFRRKSSYNLILVSLNMLIMVLNFRRKRLCINIFEDKSIFIILLITAIISEGPLLSFYEYYFNLLSLY